MIVLRSSDGLNSTSIVLHVIERYCVVSTPGETSPLVYFSCTYYSRSLLIGQSSHRSRPKAITIDLWGLSVCLAAIHLDLVDLIHNGHLIRRRRSVLNYPASVYADASEKVAPRLPHFLPSIRVRGDSAN